MILVVLWLILRALSLWYWKVNRRVDSLENIEKKLDSIQERIDRGALVKVTVTDKRHSYSPLGEQDERFFSSLGYQMEEDKAPSAEAISVKASGRYEDGIAGIAIPPRPRCVFIGGSEQAFGIRDASAPAAEPREPDGKAEDIPASSAKSSEGASAPAASEGTSAPAASEGASAPAASEGATTPAASEERGVARKTGRQYTREEIEKLIRL